MNQSELRIQRATPLYTTAAAARNRRRPIRVGVIGCGATVVQLPCNWQPGRGNALVGNIEPHS